jgi:hypothetical protein
MNGWENAPEWAVCTATDADGRTFYYEQEPDKCERQWIPKGGNVSLYTKPCPNWRDTLEKRPIPKSELPMHMPDWDKCRKELNWAIWNGQKWEFQTWMPIENIAGKIVIKRP